MKSSLHRIRQCAETSEERSLNPFKYGFDRYSSIRTSYGPSFSPDGRLVSFISDITGVPQVWVYYQETGRTDQLTVFNDRISSSRFSPTGQALAFSMDPGGSERHQIWTFDTGKLVARKLTSQDDKIHNLGGFSPDGERICYASNGRDDRFFDIYAQSLSTGDGKLLYQHDGTNYALDWLDENRILFGRANTNLDNDIFLLNLHHDEPVRLTPHGEEASFYYCGHDPSRSTICVITNRDGEYGQPAMIDLATRRLDILAQENCDATGGRVSPDGRAFAYFRNVNGTSRLHIYDVAKGRDRTVDGLPPGSAEAPLLDVYDLLAWSPDSRYLAFSFQGPRHNLNLWLYDSRARSARQLTFAPVAGIPHESFVEPVSEKYSSFDGLEIPVWAYKPYDGVRPLETVVYVHGGPEAQETARFNIIIQYLANHGFMVLAPNVRGSSGYGKGWIHLDDVEKRLDSVKDLEYLVKWAVGKGLSKPGRVAIYGGSYGGFMVLSAMTEFPDLWGAGVDLVGIANFTTFLEKTAKWRRHLRTAEYGDPEIHGELFKRISPLHNIDRLKAPLLVIHGANDPRVPVQEAEQIVIRLKELGRHVEYLRFEDEGHGIAKIQNRLRAYTAIADFFERILLGKNASATTSNTSS